MEVLGEIRSWGISGSFDWHSGGEEDKKQTKILATILGGYTGEDKGYGYNRWDGTGTHATDRQKAIWNFFYHSPWLKTNFGGEWAYMISAPPKSNIYNKAQNDVAAGNGYKGKVGFFVLRDIDYQEAYQTIFITKDVEDEEKGGDGNLEIYKRDQETKESLEDFGFVIMRQFHENQSVSSNGETLYETLKWKYLKQTDEGKEWVDNENEATKLYTDTRGKIRVNNLPVTEEIYVQANGRIHEYCSECSFDRNYTYHCLEHHTKHKSYHYVKGEADIKYKVKEVSVPDDNYSKNVGKTKVAINSKNLIEIEEFTLKKNEVHAVELVMQNEPKVPPVGNVKISGRVWLEEGNGKDNNFNDQYDSGDKLMSGVKVYWKDANGGIIAETTTDNKGEYIFAQNIQYKFCEWWIDTALYNKLNTSYIEFEYDGQVYTTVANTNINSSTTSRAVEDKDQKANLDNSFAYVNSSGPKTKEGTKVNNYNITANTKGIRKILEGKEYEIETIKRYGCLKHHYETCEEHGSHHVCDEYGGKVIKWNIKNMNLGLVKKEQPDLATTSDIAQVDVIMKGQKYEYKYGNRGKSEQSNNDYYSVEFRKKNEELYTRQYIRPVNPADISYINYKGNDKNDLEIYITYHLIVKNQSETLYGQLKEIVNYYDNRLSLVDIHLKEGNDTTKLTAQEDYKNTSSYDSNGANNAKLNKIYITALEDRLIEPGDTTPIIAIKYKVDPEKAKELIIDDILLENLSEITSYASYYNLKTITSEHKYAENYLSRYKKLYSGLDSDSIPGNVGKINFNGNFIKDKCSYEDDTDVAPTFKLTKDEFKMISGTVWEDSTDLVGNARIGNGEYGKNNNGKQEKGVKNVKVELLKIDKDGITSAAELYYIKEDKTAGSKVAVTYTDENGYYQFGNNKDQKEGVVVDNYILKYTYGNNIEEIKEGATTIDGGETVINARNYKSTIVKDGNVKNIMTESYNGGNINTNDLLWHLNLEDNEKDKTSSAVDNLDNLKWGGYNAKNEKITVKVEKTDNGTGYNENSRLAIDSLKNRNFTHARNVSAYTLPFKIQVEYTKNQYYDVNPNGERNDAGNFENNWNKFNFGIAERAREDIVVEKTIEKLRIVLANGQVLVDGDPYSGQMNYVRALGENSGDKELTRNFNKEKAVFMEMDSELIQGATLELIYRIKVRNNSEVDYEYNEKEGGNEKYYYYGDIDSAKIKQSVEYLVDYVDKDLTCEAGDGTKNAQWEKIDVSKKDDNTPSLEGNGQISKQAKEAITTGNYKAFITKEFTNIASGEEHSERLYVSKLLGNQEDDHVYENHVEIVQLNGKIARTIDSTENGKQMGKKYIPGNYEPSLSPTHEQDDSSIKLTITPPTGLPENIKLYIIVGSISLIVIAGGIVIIKRKIL